MRTRLGSTLINALKAREKAYEIRDNVLKGFLIRVQPSGVMTYYCEYARGRRIRIGPVNTMGPASARKEAQIIISKYHLGDDPAEAKIKKQIMTLKEYIKNDYTSYVLAHLKSGAGTLRRIELNFHHLYKKPLNKISFKDIDEWQARRLKEGLSPSTINRDLSSLKAALNKAVDYNYILENPIAGVKRRKVDSNPKVRYLSKIEFSNLMDVINEREERKRNERETANKWRKDREYPLLPSLKDKPFIDHIKPMIIVSLNTGMRRGELFNLTWENVNFDRKIVTVEAATAKGMRTRHISLSSATIDILLEWAKMFSTPHKLVFPNQDGKPFDNVKRAWMKLLRDAGIQKFRWHDMRHHFASRLVMAGVDLNTVRELLGHSTYDMTLRYAHLAQEHKSAAVQLLDLPYE